MTELGADAHNWLSEADVSRFQHNTLYDFDEINEFTKIISVLSILEWVGDL